MDGCGRVDASRQNDRDVGAAPIAGSHLDPAAVSPGDQIDDCQPQAGPDRAPRPVGAAEAVERTRGEMLGQAGPRVEDV